MPGQAWWKQFYANERSGLGRTGLERLFDGAPRISVPTDGALVFPHTRLSSSGALIAAAARAVIESHSDTVLVLGVLHAREHRNNSSLKGIHGPGTAFGPNLWQNEFSLDHFKSLLTLASELYGTRMPNVIERYPFLTGTDPEALAGFSELRTVRENGAALVATADMVHHGIGYGTAPADAREPERDETDEWVREHIERSLEVLFARDCKSFLERCDVMQSDFRDAGPVLAALLEKKIPFQVSALRLVDYSDVLETPPPTWVAGALVECNPIRECNTIVESNPIIV